MLYALIFFSKEVLLPFVEEWSWVLLQPMIVIIITIAGIVMMFGSVGMKISNGFGATLMNGLFSALGWMWKTAFKGIRFLIVKSFGLTPRIFRGCRRRLVVKGMNNVTANVLASIIVLTYWAILI